MRGRGPGRWIGEVLLEFRKGARVGDRHVERCGEDMRGGRDTTAACWGRQVFVLITDALVETRDMAVGNPKMHKKTTLLIR